jgi:hypothetical protein
VRFTAVAFAHSVRKIFFHAGTCGTINGPDAGSVLFEYGGAPRKIYPAVAAFTRWVGVPEECVATHTTGDVRAYVFRTGKQYVAVAWSTVALPSARVRVTGLKMYDVAGARCSSDAEWRAGSPVYLVSSRKEAITNFLKRMSELSGGAR